VLWAMPTGLYVLGSTQGASGPWNLMTLNLAVQASVTPPVVALSVERTARTHAYLDASGVAALSLLHREHRAVVRRFVKPVDVVELDGDGRPATMAGEPVALSPSGAPYLCAAAACLDLVVLERVTFDSHTLYCCEVVHVAAGAEVLEGTASERKFDVLRMEDTKMSYGG
jgi:flavin reductase (DIM6/NTAB) family NADH-FMN oxidoreductase RutF